MNILLTITLNKKEIERKPDGRKCKLCQHHDDWWDPVHMATHRALHKKRQIVLFNKNRQIEN